MFSKVRKKVFEASRADMYNEIDNMISDLEFLKIFMDKCNEGSTAHKYLEENMVEKLRNKMNKFSGSALAYKWFKG